MLSMKLLYIFLLIIIFSILVSISEISTDDFFSLFCFLGFWWTDRQVIVWGQNREIDYVEVG